MIGRNAWHEDSEPEWPTRCARGWRGVVCSESQWEKLWAEIDRFRAELARTPVRLTADEAEQVRRAFAADDAESWEEWEKRADKALALLTPAGKVEAEVARLEAELFAVRHNKREAEKQVARLEAAGDALAWVLAEYPNLFHTESILERHRARDRALEAWRALRGGQEQA